MMDLKERVKRIILLEEGVLEGASDFERVCLEFSNYLRKENKAFCFMWDDGWLAKNFENIKKIVGSEEPALILGESGSGKEIVSRFIHFLSKRKEKPFYPMNCSSEHDKEILYSQLFGHERGAYTGADRATFSPRIGTLSATCECQCECASKAGSGSGAPACDCECGSWAGGGGGSGGGEPQQ